MTLSQTRIDPHPVPLPGNRLVRAWGPPVYGCNDLSANPTNQSSFGISERARDVASRDRAHAIVDRVGLISDSMDSWRWFRGGRTSKNRTSPDD